jgi:hypothetical protein
VVQLPRDWLGPREDLVPFGRRARGDGSDTPPKDERAAEDREPQVGPPVDDLVLSAEDFWGEGSAAVQNALQGPARRDPVSHAEADVPSLDEPRRLASAFAAARTRHHERKRTSRNWQRRLPRSARWRRWSERTVDPSRTKQTRDRLERVPVSLRASPHIGAAMLSAVGLLLGVWFIASAGGPSPRTSILPSRNPTIALRAGVSPFDLGEAAVAATRHHGSSHGRAQRARHVVKHNHPAPRSSGVAATPVRAVNALPSTPSVSGTSSSGVSGSSGSGGSGSGGGSGPVSSSGSGSGAGSGSGGSGGGSGGGSPPAGPVGPGAAFGPGHLG